MKQELALRLLSEIMQWDTDKARKEFEWLSLMSKLKYDGYHDFIAGMRFLESLAAWLQQFDSSDREVAYDFVRQSLVYIGTGEMQHLVELMYPEIVQKRLRRAVAHILGVKAYRVWAHPKAHRLYQSLLRRSLFLGLSDGARIDTFRRSVVGHISNEQVVVAHQINEAKWESLLDSLRNDLGDPDARFAFVYLIDDFTGSGTTLLRKEKDGWKGKMATFWKEVALNKTRYLQEDWTLCVHHHLATDVARRIAKKRNNQATKEKKGEWFPKVEFTFGMILPPDLPITMSPIASKQFMALTDKYYNDIIETDHIRKGGTDAKLGFGQCALPLILEHNTPNNSVALLWAETGGTNGQHAMRPLFRRRERHV